MPTEIIVALIGFAGAVVGSAIGVMASAKLTSYRLEQLERKVDKHNSVIERTYRLEARCAVLEEDIKLAGCRISDLERGVSA